LKVDTVVDATGTLPERHDHRRPSEFSFPSPETLECPYPFYAAMRRESPVYKLPEREVFFVSRWEDIVFVSEHPELFSSGRAAEASLGARAASEQACPAYAGDGQAEGNEPAFSPAGLSNCDGPEHRFKRKLALKLVSPERLRRYKPYIIRTVNELIDTFIGRGEAEFVSEFAAPLPVRVICEMLGVPRDDDLFARVMEQVPSSAVRFLSGEEQEVRRHVGDQIHEHMRRVISDRHQRPLDDFLSEFVHEHEQRAGVLPLEYVITEATTLLFGGLVTTQHMFTNTMFLLLEHPGELQQVLAEPALMRPMLDESLRVESPFHLTEMLCRKDTEIAGVPIPAGAAVYKVWGSGNRDENKFEDGAAFRIGRPAVTKNHLGFGRGSHRCLGAPLALLEGTIAFEILLSRCRDIRFAPDKNDWTHVPAVSFRSLNRLFLEFDPVQR
jgi:cytochrome P450